MCCGLNMLREGARGGQPLPSPSNSLPQPLKLKGSGGGLGGRAGTSGPCPSPLKNLPNLAYGLDFGSRAVKLVYPRGRGGWMRRKLDTTVFYRDYLVRLEGQVQIDWGRLGLVPPAALVATGYGKNLLKAHFPTITEIRAHFLGAVSLVDLDHFILLEMGGQDTKVLYIREGRVFDFLTNDRCAAGTGRYLENMARFLQMPLAQFAGCWQDPVDISQTCAIFGETELVGHLLEGVDPARIAAGVNASVARRALAMVRRYRCPDLVFVGGVAKNRAVVRLLQDLSDYQVRVPAHPQFIGALGCALEAGRSPSPEKP
jgi:predicted CoA-substrate-specific enzyme activase